MPLLVLIYKIYALTIRFVFRINGGLEVEGRENIPMQGGVIVASNHISYLDPPLIGAVVPRPATFMARKGLFDIKFPVVRLIMHYYAIPVDREKTQPSTIKEAVRRLRGGELLVIFPEGRRSETGELLKGKRGVGLITKMSGARVIPAMVVGTEKALPFGARWLRRTKVKVIFDKPMDFSTIDIDKEGDVQEIITQKIMDAIGELKRRYADNSG